MKRHALLILISAVGATVAIMLSSGPGSAQGTLGPQGDITSVGATSGGGLTGGSTRGPALLGLLTTCASGEVLKWGGAAWACAAASRGLFDIRDYGAACNGSTDDTTAIQAALDAAGTAHGTVYVPPNASTCMFSNLKISPYTKLRGDHMWRSSLTRIVGSTGTALREKTVGEGNAVGATGIWIEDLFIDGNSTTGNGIDLGNQTVNFQLSTLAGMSNVTVWRFTAGTGMKLNSNASVFVNIWTVQNSVGFHLSGGGANVIHSLFSESNTSYQIRISDSNNSIFGVQMEDSTAGTDPFILVEGYQNLISGLYASIGANKLVIINNAVAANQNAYRDISLLTNGFTFTHLIYNATWSTGTGAVDTHISEYVIGEGSNVSSWYINQSTGRTSKVSADTTAFQILTVDDDATFESGTCVINSAGITCGGTLLTPGADVTGVAVTDPACSAGQFVANLTGGGTSGSVPVGGTCVAEVGDISAATVTAGGGLEGGGTSGAVEFGMLSTCASGEILKWTCTGESCSETWQCAADNNTTYSAGDGIDLTGTTFSVDPGAGLMLNGAGEVRLISTCADGEVLVSGGSGTTWTCAADGTGITNSAGANILTKSNGTNLVASSITDSGSLVSTALSVRVATTVNNTIAAGDDTGGTTDSENGWRIQPATSGNVNFDTKTFSGGSTVFRTGEGTQTGATTTWLTVDSTAGATTFPAFLTATGGVTTPASLTTTGTGTLNVAGLSTLANVIGSAISSSSLDFNRLTDADSTGYISLFGFNLGTTRFRNLEIHDGKAAAIATFTGSTKAVSLKGALAVDGDAILGNAQTDVTSIWGHVMYYGTAPTLTTCTAACSLDAYSTDARGRITCTDDSGADCTVTFANAYDTNAPACSITYEDATAPAAAPYVKTVSISAFTFDQVGGAQAHAYSYHCDGMK